MPVGPTIFVLTHNTGTQSAMDFFASPNFGTLTRKAYPSQLTGGLPAILQILTLSIVVLMLAIAVVKLLMD